jgi:hypothetical protein
MSTQAPAPEKKDEMIKHLMSRLQQSEEAIRAAEEVITHERANRKRLNADVNPNLSTSQHHSTWSS